MARIVQVPVDTAATTQKSCLLKIKSSSDSFSRMTPRREDVKQRVGSTDKLILFPASYILKSHDRRIDDSRALTGKIKIVSSTILKPDKYEKQLGDTSSKILRRSSSKNILKTYCDKSPKPMTFIECIATSKGPLTRVTQCSTKTSRGKTNYRIHLESKLKKDSSHKIIKSVTDSAKKMIPDKKLRASCERSLSRKRSVSCRKSKPEVTHRFSPDCKLARPDRADLKIDILFFPDTKDPLSHITRKNGLDPSEIPSFLKKPVTKEVCSDFSRTKFLTLDGKSLPMERCTMQKRLEDQRLQRLPSEQILRTKVMRIESAKSDKASACQKSMIAFRSCLTPKISEDTTRLPSSQELVARYKDYIPAYQLERYEACRSKRNGLQDECIPPLLQALLRKEEQCTSDIKRKRCMDKLDQNGMSESMSPTQLLLFIK